MLIPKLTICTIDNCKTLRLTESTDVYESPANPTGWGGVNIQPSDADEATITITSPSEVIYTIDILSQLPATYTEQFTFTDITVTPEDGEWTIVYSILNDTTTYSNTYKIFTTCSVRCCIDKLWKKILLSTDNGCNCGNKVIDPMEKAMFMESLYVAMKNSASCNNSDARDKILTQLQRLCKFEKCNCQ